MSNDLTKAARAIVQAYAENGTATVRQIGALAQALGEKARTPKSENLSGREFEKLYFAACMSAREAHGERWDLHCPDVRWGSVPARLASWWRVSKDGVKTRINGPRDRRIPLAKFWKDGKAPDGVVVDQLPVFNPYSDGFRRMAELNLENAEREIHLFEVHNKKLKEADPKRFEDELKNLKYARYETAAHLAEFP